MMMACTGHVVFSGEQKRRICNMDETSKFSTDGSDGGIGGRPANLVTISDTTRAGTPVPTSQLV
jgi:hypothetical protein